MVEDSRPGRNLDEVGHKERERDSCKDSGHLGGRNHMGMDNHIELQRMWQ